MDKPHSLEESYIASESSEIAFGENLLLRKFFDAFPALRHKNYTLYFIGQLTSMTGTWLQTVGQGWLVLELTHSAFWVGVVTALSALPAFFFSLFAGVIVDRVNTKPLLYYTQFFSFLFAFILGCMVITDTVNLFWICVLVTLSGIASALDLPARQAFTVELIKRADLTSAIALNAGTYNAARVIGPGLAGFLIYSFGTGGTFIINALTFLVVMLSLYFIRVQIQLPQTHSHPLQALKEGIVYAYTHTGIWNLLVFSAVASVFGWSYIAIMPIVVADVFHKDAAMLGNLYAISGVGAVLGVLLVSIFSKKVHPLTFIIGGNALFSISLLLFTFTTNVVLAAPLLFLSGLGIIMQFATINSSLQHMVEDRLRGRVMSMYSFTFMGLLPFGSFAMGLMAETFGSQIAIGSGAVITFLAGIVFFINRATIMPYFRLNTIKSPLEKTIS